MRIRHTSRGFIAPIISIVGILIFLLYAFNINIADYIDTYLTEGGTIESIWRTVIGFWAYIEGGVKWVWWHTIDGITIVWNYLEPGVAKAINFLKSSAPSQ